MEADIYIAISRKAPRAGPGRYVSVLAYNREGKECTKTVKEECEDVTPHSLELKALLGSLRRFRKPCGIRIHSAHWWMKKVYENGWAEKWRASGWMNNGKPVANAELYREILDTKERLHLEIISIDDNLGSFDTWLNNEVTRKEHK